jgi:DNA-binding MarR family transcriptional regulator
VDDVLRECLGFRLGSAYRRVDRLFNRAFARIGLTHAHGYILTCLLQAGELRARDIAKLTGFEQSTVSRLLKELVRRKLVRRRRDPDDRRSHLLSAGARAKALKDDIEHLLRRVDERLRRELPQADVLSILRAAEVMERLP